MKTTHIVVCIALCLVAAVSAETFDWGIPCTTANDCSLNKHNVYCRAVSGSESRCVQCMSEEDCERGEFCVSQQGISVDGTSKYVGQCAHKQSPLHKRCSASVTSTNVVRGSNDALFCGFVSNWNADNTPAAIQWAGSCIDKTCYECAVGATSSSGNRKCYSLSTSGRGGFWGTWRAGNSEGSIMGVNQNATAQILVVVAFFAGAIFIVLAYGLAMWTKHKTD